MHLECVDRWIRASDMNHGRDACLSLSPGLVGLLSGTIPVLVLIYAPSKKRREVGKRERERKEGEGQRERRIVVGIPKLFASSAPQFIAHIFITFEHEIFYRSTY